MSLINRTFYPPCQAPKELKPFPPNVDFLGASLPTEIFIKILSYLDKEYRASATGTNRACCRLGGLVQQQSLVRRIRNLATCLELTQPTSKFTRDEKLKYEQLAEKIFTLPVMPCFSNYMECLKDVERSLVGVFEVGCSNTQVIGAVFSLLIYQGFESDKYGVFRRAFDLLVAGKVTAVNLNDILGKDLGKEIEAISQLEDVEDKNIQAQFLWFLLLKQYQELKLQDATLLNHSLPLLKFMNDKGLRYCLTKDHWIWKGEKGLDVDQFINCLKRKRGYEFSGLADFCLELEKYGYDFEALKVKREIENLLENWKEHMPIIPFKLTANEYDFLYEITPWRKLFNAEELQRFESLKRQVEKERNIVQLPLRQARERELMDWFLAQYSHP